MTLFRRVRLAQVLADQGWVLLFDGYAVYAKQVTSRLVPGLW
jgi:hypothetical protein